MSSHSLTISLTNRYDAGSQTDAGDVFERAMNITTGNHAAYLSGASGTDTKDFYRVGIKKDETLTVRITPPSKASLTLKIYNSNRQVLQEVFAANPGAIVQTAFRATTSEDLFVEVSCDGWCSANLVNYTLNVAIQPLLRTVPPGRGTILPPTPPAPTPTPPAPPAPTPTPPAPTSAPNLMSILGIILGIIGAGIGAYFLLKEKQRSSSVSK